MATVEKISIALPSEMLANIRGAVDKGEYSSSSEVVRDAMRDWTQKRKLREQAVSELRKLLVEAVNSPPVDEPIEKMFDRLEHKYLAMAEEHERRKSA